MNRIEREKSTLAGMIEIYCRRHHQTVQGREPLCEECARLLDYAFRRLDRCPHGISKPSCRKCRIHCYAPDKRNEIRAIMRYVGPRMIFIRPIAAIRHLYTELIN